METGIREEITGLRKVITGIREEITGIRKEIRAATDVSRGMLDRVLRMERHMAGGDTRIGPSLRVTSVDDLLRTCSWFDLPASKESLLNALLDKQHSAYHSMKGLVLQQMQAEADRHGVQLPMFPEQVDCWKAEHERWQQARTALLAARQELRKTKQGGSGTAAWLPFVKGLQSYASAASRRRLPSHLRDPKHGGLVLMLVAAQAAHRLLGVLQFGAEPVLERRQTEEGPALVLDLVEVRTHPDAIGKAVQQLVAQARILVFVLATTNAQLLKVLGPLKVVGTVEVLGRTPTCDQHRLWTGKQPDVSCSAAPETASLQMQLRLRP